MNRLFVFVPVLLGALWSVSCSKSLIDNAQVEAIRPLVEQVEQQRLMDFVVEVTNVRKSKEEQPLDCALLGRSPNSSLCSLTRKLSGEILQRRFESAGLRISHQTGGTEPLTTSNIIAELPGVTHPEEIILVGAHYDAVYQGADDNTSGTAAMVEMARILSQYKFDRTIRFVGFDLEELGLIGSLRYADTIKGERIYSSIVFDGIGYYDFTPGSQRSMPGLPTPEAGDFLTVIADELSHPRAAELFTLNERLGLMKVVPILVPRDGTFTMGGALQRSDHSSLWAVGHPAMFLTDTANFRNPHYHRPTDTVDTLHPEMFRKAVQVSLAAVALWAGGPR
ncbi:MAG TPA: M28 family peptidase [Archangium sp.]|uniref:M28 family metallopeptidase n=1 Tax=Archangium sp. TaxID=1872627 RepID=UPI002E31A107|nr:M28 family peptidase [Archangium sp.]HEX5751788.1 M28 family peptidase [Archangium sp.]